MEGHEEVSCDDDGGTVVAYLKIVWNSNGREGGSLSQRNCLMECPFSISILIKAWLTWDSITFTWDAVEGVSSYQIEVDGGNSLESATKKANHEERTSIRNRAQPQSACCEQDRFCK